MARDEFSMRQKDEIITQSELRRLFHYDENLGVLIWQTRPREDFVSARACDSWNTRYAGSKTGCDNGVGYKLTAIKKRLYRSHRLIWVYHHGDIPNGLQIDHIDGNRSNNRIENLRAVTHAENSRNQKRRYDNKSGIAGVRWNGSTGKWMAMPRLNGKYHFLGLFTLVDHARVAAARFYSENGFSDRHGRER